MGALKHVCLNLAFERQLRLEIAIQGGEWRAHPPSGYLSVTKRCLPPSSCRVSTGPDETRLTCDVSQCGEEKEREREKRERKKGSREGRKRKEGRKEGRKERKGRHSVQACSWLFNFCSRLLKTLEYCPILLNLNDHEKNITFPLRNGFRVEKVEILFSTSGKYLKKSPYLFNVVSSLISSLVFRESL